MKELLISILILVRVQVARLVNFKRKELSSIKRVTHSRTTVIPVILIWKPWALFRYVNMLSSCTLLTNLVLLVLYVIAKVETRDQRLRPRRVYREVRLRGSNGIDYREYWRAVPHRWAYVQHLPTRLSLEELAFKFWWGL